MLLEMIIVMIVLLFLGMYYIVAAPALNELMSVTSNSVAVQEAGRESIAELIFTVAVYVVPVVVGVGIIIWLFVTGSKTERSQYRRVR